MKIVKSAETAVHNTDLSTESAPKARRSNRISQPRRRGVVLTKVQFNVPTAVRKKLDAASQRHDSSLSELLTGAVQRCLRDDVWSPKARNAVSRNRTVVPPLELVDMSNRLLELGMVLELLMSTATDQAELNVASMVYLDARVKLAEMRESYGC
jgi:hypothetical protein